MPAAEEQERYRAGRDADTLVPKKKEKKKKRKKGKKVRKKEEEKTPRKPHRNGSMKNINAPTV